MTDPTENTKDRRKSQRIYRHGPADAVRDSGKSETVRVQIMNISEGGVRIVASEAFDPGERFTITIGDDEKICEVRHCKQLFEGYSVRLEFVS